MTDEARRIEVQKAVECNDAHRLKQLIGSGADIDIPNRMDITPLMFAAYNGNVECVKLLLDAGADLKRRGPGGRSAVHFAIRSSIGPLSAKVLEILVNAGADLNATDNDRWSPMHSAGAAGDENSLRFLISLGTDIDPIDLHGRTPLHLCARNKRRGTARILINNGANINRQDGFGMTPLHYAADAVSIENMRFFLTAGSDLYIKNYNDNTALDILKQNSVRKYGRYAEELCRLYDTVSIKRLKKEDTRKAAETGYEFNI